MVSFGELSLKAAHVGRSTPTPLLARIGRAISAASFIPTTVLRAQNERFDPVAARFERAATSAFLGVLGFGPRGWDGEVGELCVSRPRAMPQQVSAQGPVARPRLAAGHSANSGFLHLKIPKARTSSWRHLAAAKLVRYVCRMAQGSASAFPAPLTEESSGSCATPRP